MNDTPRKTIVILSPEPFGKMLISKMHYALELVRKGYRVFFVNPPRKLAGTSLAEIAEQRDGGNLVIIDINAVPGSLFLRHKLPFLFRQINRRYVTAIKKISGKSIDQVWCFNPNLFVDLKLFRADRTILLLYDFYRGKHVFKAASSADVIISVSQLILDHYKDVAPPKLLVQHGLGEHFAGHALEKIRTGKFTALQGGPVRIGYVGNLLRSGMNTSIAMQVIRANRKAEFHFWGPYSRQDNNVTNADAGIQADLGAFIEFLRRQENVILHGVADQPTLAEGLFQMDMFLFLYSPRTELNAASNAHKIVEYLSTGKVTVSTHVSNYSATALLEMCEKDGEEKLPEIFERVIGHLGDYNSADNQQRRMAFALDNTYVRQVDRILEFAGK